MMCPSTSMVPPWQFVEAVSLTQLSSLTTDELKTEPAPLPLEKKALFQEAAKQHLQVDMLHLYNIFCAY